MVRVMVSGRGGDHSNNAHAAVVMGCLVLVSNWLARPALAASLQAPNQQPQPLFQNGLPLNSPAKHFQALATSAQNMNVNGRFTRDLSRASYRPIPQWNTLEEVPQPRPMAVPQEEVPGPLEEQSHQPLESDMRYE